MAFRGQNEEFEIRAAGRRFQRLAAAALCAFALLLCRLWILQIYHGEELRRYSENNRFKKQFLSSPRGLILDRNGKLLVGNRKAVQLRINLNHAADIKKLIKKISPVISLSESEIEARLERGKAQAGGPFHPITIKPFLRREEIYKLKMLHWDFPGISVEEISARIYPLGENGSQIFGFVGGISKEEVRAFKSANRLFHYGETVGKSGLEKLYNEQLRGVSGLQLVEVDARNRVSPRSVSPPSLFIQKPRPGKDIVLTIDRDLQEAAFRAMDRQDRRGPRQGAVIVMKTDGEILAWLSRPGFNASLFSSEKRDRLWRELLQSGSKYFVNKGFQEHYSPGSTFKPFIALAALQEGIITESSLVDSPGKLRLGGRVYHNYSPKGLGPINVEEALERSANTFFYKMGRGLGIKKINRYVRMFGFGKKTMVDISGESQGLLPAPQWKKRVMRDGWRGGDTINISIGQGYLLTTLLQLAAAYGAIATEGILARPFIVRRAADGKEKKPEVVDILTDRIKRRHFLTVKRGLRRVIEGAHGTARFIRIPGLSFAGKTGTAQVVSLASKEIYKECLSLPRERRHHGWFLSFAPFSKPEIIVAVFTESSCSGSGGSGPVARDIISFYMKKRKEAL